MGAGGIVMALSLAWNAAGAELLRVEKSAEAMGSTFGVIVYGTDRARLDAAADAALGEAQRLDRMLSNYLADSEWSEVNRDAGIRPVRLSAELFQLISDCMKYSRQSGGAFDIAVGPLMKAWGFYRGEGGLPKADEVRNALARTGYRHVLLDPAAHTIRFDRPGVELDPGGIGKGYAVDRMVEVLKESGVEIALVSAAGSSIYGLGAPPDEPQGWRVVIRSPKDAKQPAVVFLKNESLSTSGSYEKFFWAGGRRYSHIMDPRNGYPARGAASVSVLAPRTIDSEAWAKPYFINGRAWTAAHRPKDFRVFFCDDTKEQACSWVH
jgi:thiamine biosynthesis lipoprotein